MARRQRSYILFVAVHVHHGVGGYKFGIAAGEDVLSVWSEDARQFRGSDLESITNRSSRRRDQAGIDDERSRASQKVVLPDVRRDRCDTAANVRLQVLGRAPGELHPRRKSIQISAVTWLRIYDEFLLRAARTGNKAEARGALCAFRNGSVDLVAKAVIENEAIRDLPSVLEIQAARVAINGGRANVLAIGEIRRRYSPVVCEWASRQQAAERVGKGIANLNVMCSALGRNVYR